MKTCYKKWKIECSVINEEGENETVIIKWSGIWEGRIDRNMKRDD